MKKGFTLIELLAVIVILAIIATIAVPIVLGVINNTKVSSKKSSAQNYLDAVMTSIVDSNVEKEGDFYPDECIINESGNLLCDGSIEEIVVKMDGEKPTAGDIVFFNKQIYTANLVFYDIAVILDENGDITLDEETYKKVIEVGEKKYSVNEISTALENSSKETPLKLNSDITITNVNVLDADKDMYLNLNKKTITVSNTGAILLKGIDASLTVSNGNFIAQNNSSALYVGTDNEDVSKVIRRQLIIEDDVKIVADSYGVAGFGKSTIDLKGKIVVNGSGYGLSGNGDINNENTTFNIYETAEIIAENGVALYLPQTGITTIHGGALKGKTVIGIKSGSLIIKNGTFEAIGEKKEPSSLNDGINPTGDVILIEENVKYDGNININIQGGNFTSKNGYIIQENNTSGRTTIVTGVYSTKNQVSGTTNRYYYTK